jgi:hypothetical protein
MAPSLVPGPAHLPAALTEYSSATSRGQCVRGTAILHGTSRRRAGIIFVVRDLSGGGSDRSRCPGDEPGPVQALGQAGRAARARSRRDPGHRPTSGRAFRREMAIETCDSLQQERVYDRGLPELSVWPRYYEEHSAYGKVAHALHQLHSACQGFATSRLGLLPTLSQPPM